MRSIGQLVIGAGLVALVCGLVAVQQQEHPNRSQAFRLANNLSLRFNNSGLIAADNSRLVVMCWTQLKRVSNRRLI